MLYQGSTVARYLSGKPAPGHTLAWNDLCLTWPFWTRSMPWLLMLWPVTVKTFGLLLDQVQIWLVFPDFKHDCIRIFTGPMCVLSATVRGLVIFAVTAWLLALPGHQQPWQNKQFFRLLQGGLSISCTMEILRNDRKCKHMIFVCFPKWIQHDKG